MSYVAKKSNSFSDSLSEFILSLSLQALAVIGQDMGEVCVEAMMIVRSSRGFALN